MTPEEAAEFLVRNYKQKTAARVDNLLKQATPQFQQELARAPVISSTVSISKRLLQCEKPEVKDAALAVIDLETIYGGVDKRMEEGETKYGYTDLIVMETLKWFKRSFFKWVNTPELTGKTGGKLIGIERPTYEEATQGGASVVEIYQYDDGTIYRFPRYNDPLKLLEWRQGRCGEWAFTFYLILRALDIQSRYVWNKEDHVWCEVFSSHLGRWVHVDSCEEAYDNPTLYNRGWGKKMSYCLSIGLEGTMDVSRRYVVDDDKKLPRNLIDEKKLKNYIDVLNAFQRRNKSPDDLMLLYLLDGLEKMDLNGQLKTRKNEDAPALPRQSGAPEWTEARGEAGK